jgi:hypothetical protein
VSGKRLKIKKQSKKKPDKQAVLNKLFLGFYGKYEEFLNIFFEKL